MANEWHLVNAGPTPVMLLGVRLEPGVGADVPEEWYGYFSGYPGLVFTRNVVAEPEPEPVIEVEEETPAPTPAAPRPRPYTKRTTRG